MRKQYRKEKRMAQKRSATVSWNKPNNEWVIRLWDEEEQEFVFSSSYPVKDVNPDTQLGWVSELIVCKLFELQDLGYEITFRN